VSGYEFSNTPSAVTLIGMSTPTGAVRAMIYTHISHDDRDGSSG
jgi:hypothetical protein